MRIEKIEKYAHEEIFRYHQFLRADGRGWLNTLETITGTPTVTIAEKVAGTDRSSTMISNIAIYSNTRVIYKLLGGTAGIVYTITIRIVSSNGQKFEDRVEVTVL